VDPEGLSPDYDKDGDGEVDGNADLSQLAPSPDIPTVSAKDLILMATPVVMGLPPMPVAWKGPNRLAGLRLGKSLASQAQMNEAGTIMAGRGAKVPFRGAGRAAKQYGGNASDWTKKTSSSYTARDNTQFETHWVENIKTSQRVEFKTKFTRGQ
ncbi:MAG: hypothetical protein KJ804_12375, partial [Proteobacteria bacterium]|nr:hypothetical protein [Pseudomonadota bacterium]MBU1059100.1 hypothetical protein [Pseudomonadota bacterium]